MVELLLMGKPLFRVGAFGLGDSDREMGNRPTDDLQKNQDPLMILKNRFVLGEITEDEFKRMKQEL